MRKKWVGIFLVFTMCLSVVAVSVSAETSDDVIDEMSAANEITAEIVNTNFSDGEIPSGIGLNMYGNASVDVYTPNGEEKQVLAYRTPGAKESWFTLVSSEQQQELAGSNTLVMKTKLKRTGYALSLNLFRIYGNSNFNSFTLGNDGFIYAGSNAVNAGRYVSDEWYEFTVAVDMVNGKLSAYLNNIPIIENQSAGITDLNVAGIRLMYHPAASGSEDVYYEYMQVYYTDKNLEEIGKTGIPELQLPVSNTQVSASGAMRDLASLSVSAQDVINRFKQRGNVHPRIMATTDDFERLKEIIKTDAKAAQWYEKILQDADEMVEYLYAVGFESGNLLSYARDVLENSTTLGLAYNLTSDKKYADKLYELLESIAGYSNWNPSHFLDEAEMSAAVAIGYDWIYNALTAEQRKCISDALVEKCVKLGLNSFNTGDTYAQWRVQSNNWCQVCSGGLIVGATAVLDEVPELSAELISQCLMHMAKVGLQRYETDGSYFEGPGYYGYSTNFLIYAAASLQSSLGTDFGVLDFPGLEKASNFMMATYGPMGAFNYNDASENALYHVCVSYLAKRYNQQEVAKTLQQVKETVRPLDLLWFLPCGDGVSDLPLDQVYYDYPMFTARSTADYGDQFAIWTGLKGQKGGASRMDLDGGSFMLDALGVRWAMDYGVVGSYDSSGYFVVSNNGKRYQYFPKRAEAHNTFVINPDKNADQVAQIKAPIVKSESGAGSSYAIVDMAPLYEGKTISAQRGLMLFDNRSKVAVRDEIQMKEPSEYYWFMQTEADVQILSGGKTAVLSKNGKRLMARLISDQDLSFEVSRSDFLPQSNTGMAWTPYANRLSIHASSVERIALSVVFIPLREEDKLNTEQLNIAPLAEWKTEDTCIEKQRPVTLTGISIDGIRMMEFSPIKYDYQIMLDADSYSGELPQVKAYAPVNREIQMFDISGMPGMTRIAVRDENDSSNYSYYTLSFSLVKGLNKKPAQPAPLLKEMPKGYEEVMPATVQVSDVPQAENHERNLFDHNYTTRWAADGNNHWVIMEYDKEYTFGAVALAIMGGLQRVHPITISVSKDGKTWKQVFDGATSVGTEEMFYIPFENTVGKYVKLEISSSTFSSWNSVTEFWALAVS